MDNSASVHRLGTALQWHHIMPCLCMLLGPTPLGAPALTVVALTGCARSAAPGSSVGSGVAVAPALARSA